MGLQIEPGKFDGEQFVGLDLIEVKIANWLATQISLKMFSLSFLFRFKVYISISNSVVAKLRGTCHLSLILTLLRKNL